MNEQELISKWLTLAGVESPSKPQFPENDNFHLGLNLILEELFEAAEAGTDKQYKDFVLTVKKEVDKRIATYKDRERNEGNLDELRDACADMRVVMGNLIHFSGIKDQFGQDFDDVMKSNFSKFCNSEQEAVVSVEAYASGTHPNKMGEKIECFYEQVGEYWIVKVKETKKVMKSINFKDVEFK